MPQDLLGTLDNLQEIFGKAASPAGLAPFLGPPVTNFMMNALIIWLFAASHPSVLYSEDICFLNLVEEKTLNKAAFSTILSMACPRVSI